MCVRSYGAAASSCIIRVFWRKWKNTRLPSASCATRRRTMRSEKPTVRAQFEAIMKGVEQEAIEAAQTLGFQVKSKQKLLADIEREQDYWREQYLWDA